MRARWRSWTAVFRRLAEVMRRDLGVDIAALPGAGAAGGLGAGLAGFLGAHLRAGPEWVIEAIGLEQRRLQGADLLVTGEGRLDSQSLRGKAPVSAGRLARRGGVRAVALVGSVGEGWERVRGDAFDDVSGDHPRRHAVGGGDAAGCRLDRQGCRWAAALSASRGSG